MKIEIFDSTLRDGAQSEGISFSVSDKLNIVRTLDDFGVAYIEAGNPGSNPKDIEFFQKAANLRLKNAVLCAFGKDPQEKYAGDRRPEHPVPAQRGNTDGGDFRQVVGFARP